MPRYTEPIDLREERDRIDSELDALAADLAELDSDSPKREELNSRGNRMERFLAGLEWAIDPPDDDPTRDEPYEEVTLGALSAGEYADLTDTAAADASTTKSVAGSSRVLYATKGLVDAPFINEGMNEAQRLSAVSDLQPQFQKWLAWRVDGLSTYDIEGNGFAARVAEQQQETTEEN